MMHKKTRWLALLVIACALTLSVGDASAAICGFPFIIASGAAPAPSGWAYVVLFVPAPPFGFAGIGGVTQANAHGVSCKDDWRHATIGPAPPNFEAIWAPFPAAPACSAPGCAGPAFCTPPAGPGATFCLTFG